MDFNEAKFKELVVYLARECSDDVLWGLPSLINNCSFATSCRTNSSVDL